MAAFQLDDLGERAKSRPTPSLHGTMAAVGGLVIVVGLTVLTGEKFSDSGSTGAGILSGLLLAIAGYAVLAKVSERVRAAGVAMIALGIVTVGMYIVVNDLDSLTTLMLIFAVGFAGAYFAPLSRGEQTFAVGALGSTWLLVLDIVSNRASLGPLGLGSVGFSPFEPVNDTTVAYISLAIGLGLLLAARRLDADGFNGLATATVIVGDLAFLVGVFALIGTFNSDGLGSLVVIVAGIILGVVGSAEGRRFTTWLGGLLTLAGIIALVVDAFSESGDSTSIAITLMAIGGLIVAAIAYMEQSDSPDSDGSSAGGVI